MGPATVHLCGSSTPDARAWLDRHPRIPFHFTPTLGVVD